MKTNNFYTNEEDVVIISAVNTYPQNIKLALEKASITLGRPVSGVTFRWYKTLRLRQFEKSNNSFKIEGKKCTSPINTKNQVRTKTLTGIITTIQTNLKNIETSINKLDGVVNDSLLLSIKTSLNKIYEVF